MGSDLAKLRRQWPRVMRRASGGYQKQFTEKMGRLLKDQAWQPSDRQLQLMQDMCRAYDADLPDIGEIITTPSGKEMMWAGAVGQWVEVRQ